MAIEIIDGFQVISADTGWVLGIESDRLEEYIAYALKKGITKIFVNSNFGYKLDNVDFLKQHNFFTHLAMTDESIEISGIYHLTGLKFLSLSNGKQPVDLSRFKKLEDCSIEWNNKINGLAEKNGIKRLSIWRFKPRSKDFADLAGCSNVTYFHITESNIESFEGIASFSSLEHFEGHYLPKLESLNGLETIAHHLKVLVFDYCRKLANYETVLSKLAKLEKLMLGDCGPLASIKFVQKLQRLDFFSFVNTNVLDGDISPAIGLNYVGFDDKRHYSHKMKDVNK